MTLAPGATTTAEELHVWAHEYVPEQAAAPKSVSVLDALPVTEVGKPFKPALRALATQDAVNAALQGVRGVKDVSGVVDGGAVVAVVSLDAGADAAAVKHTLDRFAITWRTEQS